MKVKKIVNKMGQTFYALFECEHCWDETNGFGCDDDKNISKFVEDDGRMTT